MLFSAILCRNLGVDERYVALRVGSVSPDKLKFCEKNSLNSSPLLKIYLRSRPIADNVCRCLH